MCNGIYTGVSGGRTDLRGGAASAGPDKADAGQDHVSLVVTGAVLGFLGIYEPLPQWAGAGATVPLTGFGNTLWKGIARAMGEDGILGIFKGGFTASAVGISGALVFGYLGSLVFKPKMKG